MTEKKQLILEVALELFAKNGVDATSTNKIAKEANVSEGLIFRHFGNKKGLLSAILEFGTLKAEELFSNLSTESDPQRRLEAILMIPFNIREEEFPFWKLLYAIKWQAKDHNVTMSEYIQKLLIRTFSELNYSNPKEEAELVIFLFDGLAAGILLKKIQHTEKLKQLILSKYITS